MCESAPLRCGGPRPRSGPSGGVYCVSAVSRRDARGSRDAVVVVAYSSFLFTGPVPPPPTHDAGRDASRYIAGHAPTPATSSFFCALGGPPRRAAVHTRRTPKIIEKHTFDAVASAGSHFHKQLSGRSNTPPAKEFQSCFKSESTFSTSLSRALSDKAVLASRLSRREKRAAPVSCVWRGGAGLK